MALYEIKQLQSRAATAENMLAQVGQGGQAGKGRKGAPALANVHPGDVVTLLDTDGPGMVRHIWITISEQTPHQLRNAIIRFYWDNQEYPSIEVPMGDFFGIAHGRKVHYDSEFMSVFNGLGFNCWLKMPFRDHAKMTFHNDGDENIEFLFYQVDFTLADDLADNTGYLHAQFRRQNPVPRGEDHIILDGVQGSGVYIGSVIGVRDLYPKHWWGEGEVKFYIDGDSDFPTICGTGTEDYVGAAWGLQTYSARYAGAPLLDVSLYSFYRWHVTDPIYFQQDLKVTIQDIGIAHPDQLREDGISEEHLLPTFGVTDGSAVYYNRSDDFSSTAFWYMGKPIPLPKALPDKEARSVGLEAESSK